MIPPRPPTGSSSSTVGRVNVSSFTGSSGGGASTARPGDDTARSHFLSSVSTTTSTGASGVPIPPRGDIGSFSLWRDRPSSSSSSTANDFAHNKREQEMLKQIGSAAGNLDPRRRVLKAPLGGSSSSSGSARRPTTSSSSGPMAMSSTATAGGGSRRPGTSSASYASATAARPSTSGGGGGGYAANNNNTTTMVTSSASTTSSDDKQQQHEIFRSPCVGVQVALHEIAANVIPKGSTPDAPRARKLFELLRTVGSLCNDPIMSHVLHVLANELEPCVFGPSISTIQKLADNLLSAAGSGAGGKPIEQLMEEDEEETPYFEQLEEVSREHRLLIAELNAVENTNRQDQITAELERFRAIVPFYEHEIGRLTRETSKKRDESDGLKDELATLQRVHDRTIVDFELQNKLLLKDVRELQVRLFQVSKNAIETEQGEEMYTMLKTTKADQLQGLFEQSNERATVSLFMIQIEFLVNTILARHESSLLNQPCRRWPHLVQELMTNDTECLLEEYNELADRREQLDALPSAFADHKVTQGAASANCSMTMSRQHYNRKNSPSENNQGRSNVAVSSMRARSTSPVSSPQQKQQQHEHEQQQPGRPFTPRRQSRALSIDDGVVGGGSPSGASFGGGEASSSQSAGPAAGGGVKPLPQFGTAATAQEQQQQQQQDATRNFASRETRTSSFEKSARAFGDRLTSEAGDKTRTIEHISANIQAFHRNAVQPLLELTATKRFRTNVEVHSETATGDEQLIKTIHAVNPLHTMKVPPRTSFVKLKFVNPMLKNPSRNFGDEDRDFLVEDAVKSGSNVLDWMPEMPADEQQQQSATTPRTSSREASSSSSMQNRSTKQQQQHQVRGVSPGGSTSQQQHRQSPSRQQEQSGSNAPSPSKNDETPNNKEASPSSSSRRGRNSNSIIWDEYRKRFGTYHPAMPRRLRIDLCDMHMCRAFFIFHNRMLRRYQDQVDAALRTGAETLDSATIIALRDAYESFSHHTLQSALLEALEEVYVYPELVMKVGWELLTALEIAAVPSSPPASSEHEPQHQHHHQHHPQVKVYMDSLAGKVSPFLGNFVALMNFKLDTNWPEPTASEDDPAGAITIESITALFLSILFPSDAALFRPDAVPSCDTFMEQFIGGMGGRPLTLAVARKFLTNAIISQEDPWSLKISEALAFHSNDSQWSELDGFGTFEAVKSLIATDYVDSRTGVAKDSMLLHHAWTCALMTRDNRLPLRESTRIVTELICAATHSSAIEMPAVIHET